MVVVKLFAQHLGAAFRAFLIVAGLASHMVHLVTAIRTDAIAFWSGSLRAPHPAPTLTTTASSSAACPTAASASLLSHSYHFLSELHRLVVLDKDPKGFILNFKKLSNTGCKKPFQTQFLTKTLRI